MAYTVIIVEDESVAAENLRDIIRLHCPAFEVVGHSRNGENGLESIRGQRPDLVLCDIRMPRMDGLELIKLLCEELPEIRTVIVSGYQDFEYVRTALQYGAADYLLKPVGPAALCAVLERVAAAIDADRQRSRVQMLNRICSGQDIAEREINRYFPEQAYVAAIARKNGLPSRFLSKRPGDVYFDGGETISLFGRDEMESLYVVPAHSLTQEQFVTVAEKAYSGMEGYITTVIWDEPFKIGQLPDILLKLYRTLDSSLIIGLSQVIQADRAGGASPDKPEINPEIARLVEFYAREKNRHKIIKIFDTLLIQCQKERRTQLGVENIVRILLSQPFFSDMDNSLAYSLDDAFHYATCYEDLMESLYEIIGRLFPQSGAVMKMDTPEFYDQICRYINENLTKPLSLKSIGGEFGISPTYLSQLFRKYAGQSLNNYLTFTRIDKAKALLMKKTMLVKEVAAAVGFADQFYFSRIFHSYIGTSPSEYASGAARETSALGQL